MSPDDLVGLHGARVLGYNQVKHVLGEDLAVAHGLWKSTAHKRYDRFALERVVLIPTAVAGLAEPAARVEPDASVERPAGPPRQKLVRKSSSSRPVLQVDASSDASSEVSSGASSSAGEESDAAEAPAVAAPSHGAPSDALSPVPYWLMPSRRRLPRQR